MVSFWLSLLSKTILFIPTNTETDKQKGLREIFQKKTALLQL